MDAHAHPPSSPARASRHKTPNESSSVASTATSSTPRRPADMGPKKPAVASAPKGARGPPSSRPGKPSESDRTARSSSKDGSLSSHARSSAEPQPDKNEEVVKTLRTDLDSLRSHVTCKICDRLLYEPYVISCGHTYCYSCLCTWFINNRARKTCPDCRALVVQAPAPAYLVREMALVFISRVELLPPGETLEQHAKWRKEEAELVQQDRNNPDPRTGGLFKGCFRVRQEPALRAIRDEEDGVDRCPMCAYELEHGLCPQCGLEFDDEGMLWSNSFGGFSDMDEGSEQDLSVLSGEDAEFGPEDPEPGYDFDDYDNGMEDWQEDFDDDHSYAVRRWLANEAIVRPNGPFPQGPRRRAAHSAAGGRRRSYSASLVSEMLTEDTEMGTVEEEEEDEDGDDGDSSMNDFIVEEETERASQRSASTTSQTSTPRRQLQTQRRRRVVSSESSSSVSRESQVGIADNDDDEEPIAHGRRQRQTRPPAHGQLHRRAQIPPSVSTENASDSPGPEEEDTQALLHYQAGWSPLENEDFDEEMEEDEDGDDSDGARTTVGWEPTANSNERYRIGGSLTPTADRPNVAIRPPSRAGNPRIPDGSRGLRRRSSVLSSVSSANYEDGEADDDDSDIDRDGDTRMGAPALRTRGSRLHLRQMGLPSSNRSQNQTFSAAIPLDPDTDDNSDNSTAASRRRPRIRPQRQEYDPRISWAFAQHMADIRDLERPETLMDHLDQLRATTPVVRPRTANRTRGPPSIPPISPLSTGSMPPFSPIESSTPRPRTSSVEIASAAGSATSPRSERLRNSTSQVAATSPSANITGGNVRRQSASSVSSGSALSNAPSTRTQEPSAISRNGSVSAADTLERPSSRVSSRPPSAAGRRSSGVPHQPYQGGPISPGLNFAARFQAQQFTQPFSNNRNPFNPFIPLNPVPRPRQSVQRLREQSSTATLRPRISQRGLRSQPSQASVRDGTVPAQLVRQQPSRINLRPQPSHHRLSSQASTRTLRGTNPTGPHQAPVPGPSTSPRDSARSRLTEEERLSRARELISSRQQALGTNPFVGGRSRQSAPASDVSVPGGSRAQYQHQNQNQGSSSLSLSSGGSSVASSSSQASPQSVGSPEPAPTGLGRRRSSRNIAVTPAAFLPVAVPPTAAAVGGSGGLGLGRSRPVFDGRGQLGSGSARATDLAGGQMRGGF